MEKVLKVNVYLKRYQGLRGHERGLTRDDSAATAVRTTVAPMEESRETRWSRLTASHTSSAAKREPWPKNLDSGAVCSRLLALPFECGRLPGPHQYLNRRSLSPR